MTRHYSEATFVVTDKNPAYDGSPTVNRSGYCSVCFGDMQSFGHAGRFGPLKHYASHRHAIRLGLWGAKLIPVSRIRYTVEAR